MVQAAIDTVCRFLRSGKRDCSLIDRLTRFAQRSKRGRITKIRKEIAIILYEQGKSQEQITRCLKLKNRASIQYYLRTREKAPDAEAPGKVTSFIPG